MQEILYLEIPTPDTAAVRTWLQADFAPEYGEKMLTPAGFCLKTPVKNTTSGESVSEGLPDEF